MEIQSRGSFLDSRLSVKKGLLWNQLKEYCQHSGLHGVRYLSDSSRPVAERIWWALSILLSLVGISMLIFRVWNHWTSSPVIVSFSETTTPIWQIPFPAVTICPQVKYDRSRFDLRGMEQRRGNLTKAELKLLDDLMLVCKNPEANMHEDEKYPDLTDEHSVINIATMAHSIYEVVDCGFQIDTDCLTHFQGSLTREGFCFSFNLMPKSTLFSKYVVPRVSSNQVELWSLEHGYSPSAGLRDKPLRASGTGFRRSLVLLLKTRMLSLDYKCRRIQGFKVSLTNPAEAPRMLENYYFLPTSGLTQLLVEPHVMETSESLRSYPPDKRHCIFPSERRLAFFTTYTQSNCELECLTNFTLRECGCVEFYMPRNQTTPICGLRKTRCVYYAELNLTMDTMDKSIKHVTNDKDCHCLPECISIQYSAEVSQGDFDIMTTPRAKKGKPNEFKNIDANVVIIFFKDSEFYASRRSELYGYVDFLANCGGLLGLCCGFSILSLVEIVYYFTLRLWVNFRRRNQTRLCY